MVKITICKNGKIRMYGLNPYVQLRKPYLKIKRNTKNPLIKYLMNEVIKELK